MWCAVAILDSNSQNETYSIMTFSSFRLFHTDAMGVHEHTLKFLGFPGGERHVWLPSGVAGAGREYTIDARLYSSDGVMDLLLLNDALRRVVGERAVVNLKMPYVPYARQDRVTVAGEPLSAKVFCTLINSMKFDQVRISDPHSPVTTALLERVEAESAEVFVKQILALPEFARGVALVAPDAGAHKRVQAMGDSLCVPVVLCGKTRDTQTGRLSKAQVIGDPADIPQVPLLVVDDICDGGGTFSMLSAMLKQVVSSELSLYVTHGLYTKGVEPLADYKNLFTAYPRDLTLWRRREGDVYQVMQAARLAIAA